MAKALADYRKELDEIKEAVEGFAEPLKKNIQFMGQTPGLIENGEKELGLRIQSLKAKGKQGTALSDFLSDPGSRSSRSRSRSTWWGWRRRRRRCRSCGRGRLRWR
jgi:hypothetical protein